MRRHEDLSVHPSESIILQDLSSKTLRVDWSETVDNYLNNLSVDQWCNTAKMSTTCRLCLRNSSDMLPLFETLIENKLMVEIILSTLGVELDNSLDLPRQVCMDCLKNVNFLYIFYRELVRTQSLLSQWKSECRQKVGGIEQMDAVNPQGDDCEIVEQDEIVKTEPIDIDDGSETSSHHIETTDFNQERIEHEAITIKHELAIVDEEEMYEDETTNSYGNDNLEDPLPKKRKWKQSKKVVEFVPHKCFICGPTLENEKQLKKHLMSHRRMLPYECSQCSTATNPIILKHVTLLNRHFESHSFNYTCRLCPLRFRTRCTLYYHRRTIHDKETSQSHTCSTCGKLFNNTLVYRKHVRGHISIMTQQYKCEICQQLFHSLNSLRRHRKVHAKRKAVYE